MVDCTSTFESPRIFQLEQKPQHVLCHDFGAGAPCLKCHCDGLELHYWRKICKKCKCRMDEHDVQLRENNNSGEAIIGRLFETGSSYSSQEEMRSITEKIGSINFGYKNAKSEQSTGGSVGAASTRRSSCSSSTVTSARSHAQDLSAEYSWTPTANADLAKKYFESLPAEERPLLGTDGERLRRQRLAYQLPFHDCDAGAAVSITSPKDRELHSRFVDTVKKDAVGIGHVVECEHPHLHSQETQTERPTRSAGSCKLGSCQTNLKKGDVGVATNHGKQDDVWHPNCFRCATCEQLLVDLLYFFKDNKYYCGRHYAEKMHPRCFGCDELIFAQEYTLAEDKNWHVEHFCCFGCDQKLGGHRYLVKHDHPYCITCYMDKFARVCNTCRNKISPEMQRVSHKDMNWHSDVKCFRCKQCTKSLLHEKFIIKNDETFCSVQCKDVFCSN